MFTVKQALIRRSLFGFLLLIGVTAQAFSLFPDKEDQVRSVMRKTDAILTRADDAYEQGDAVKAKELYTLALQRYEDIHATNPDLHEGLPRFRINHCKGQLASLSETTVTASEASSPVPADTAEPKRKGVWSRLFGKKPQPSPVATIRDLPSAATNRSDWPIPAEVISYKSNAPQQPDIIEAPVPAPLVDAVVPSVPARPSAPAYASPAPESEAVDPARIKDDLAEARRMIEDERLSDATRTLVQVLRIDPGNRSARLMIALVHSRQGRYDEALAALEDLKSSSEDLPLLLAFSAANCAAGRYFDAMLFLDKAIQLAPEHPYAYYNLAWLHLVMNDNTAGRRDAEAYYRRAIRLGARRDKALEVKLGLE